MAEVTPARSARDNRPLIHRGRHGDLVDFRQRVLCLDQGIVPDRDVRIYLPWFIAGEASADVLHRAAIRRRGRPGAYRMVERSLAVPRVSLDAALPYRRLGRRLRRRSSRAGRIRANLATCDGGRVVTGDGYRR